MDFTTHRSFSSLPEDAKNLAKSYREINPFVCDLWLQQFEAFLVADNEETIYVVAMQDGRCRLVLPLLLTHISRLRIAKVRSMTNFYSTIFSPLYPSQPQPSEIVEDTVEYLQTEFSKAALLEFEPLRDDCLVGMFSNHGENNAGWIPRSYHKHVNCYETVAGDNYNDYLQRRPSQLKNTIRRKRKLLDKEADSSLNIYSTVKEVADHFSEFCLVYEQSWKGEESHPEFINQILQDLAGIGKAKLAILSVNEEPAAAQIWLKIGSAWGVFKLAYTPQFKRYSVGTLLTAGLLEHLLAESNVSEIDFLSGDDAYKRDWVDSKREHVGVELVNSNTLIGKLLSFKRRLSS